MLVDLHCHTSASDGELAPPALLQRAVEAGVQLLAITDHDVLGGYREAAPQVPEGLWLVPGVELSSQWGGINVHVVGLNFDPDHERFAAHLAAQSQAREQRAQLIGERLAKLGFAGCYEGAKQLAGGAAVGRPHFARFLVEQRHVDSEAKAFKRFLGPGKVGDIKTSWPTMEQAIGWIVDSGGVAVLAHPFHYELTATRLRVLVQAFQAAGGRALEVLSGRQASDRTMHLAQLCQRFGLLASSGSDYHGGNQPWSTLACQGRLPAGCEPVWADWSPPTEMPHASVF